MRCIIALAGLLAVLPSTGEALAITAKEKMVTCKFGADDQKLAGAEKQKFIAKCMAKGDAPGKKMSAPAQKPAQ